MSQSPLLGSLELTLDGNLSELARLSRETAQFCLDEALGDDVAFPLNLALEELLTNAIEHGGCRGLAGAAIIRIGAAENSLQVEFRDRGVPFDPLSAPPPDLQAGLEQRAEGGLGVHFVRQIMRGIEYHRCGAWNRLTMQLPVPAREEGGRGR